MNKKEALAKLVEALVNNVWEEPLHYFYLVRSHDYARHVAWDEILALLTPKAIDKAYLPRLQIVTKFDTFLTIATKPSDFIGKQYAGGVIHDNGRPKDFDRTIETSLATKKGWLETILS